MEEDHRNVEQGRKQKSAALLYIPKVWEMEEKLKKDWIYKRGDIYLANLNPIRGSEQGGKRPVVVLQNNVGNFFSTTLIVAPLTSQIDKKRNQPTHVYVGQAKGLEKPSVVQLEHIRTIDKVRVVCYIGKLSRDQMRKVQDACFTSLGYKIPEEMEAP